MARPLYIASSLLMLFGVVSAGLMDLFQTNSTTTTMDEENVCSCMMHLGSGASEDLNEAAVPMDCNDVEKCRANCFSLCKGSENCTEEILMFRLCKLEMMYLSDMNGTTANTDDLTTSQDTSMTTTTGSTSASSGSTATKPPTSPDSPETSGSSSGSSSASSSSGTASSTMTPETTTQKSAGSSWSDQRLGGLFTTTVSLLLTYICLG